MVLPVPVKARALKGRPKVGALRAAAREALLRSVRYSGLRLDRLEKDDNGAPLPYRGVYWSLSHKSAFVAAVAARRPVGIDIEKVRKVSEGLRRRLADEAEWRLAENDDLWLFFRYWTAKEAVLKAVGKGLTGLSRCRIDRIVDADRLLLSYGRESWTVTHCRVGDDHLAAITSGGTDLIWHLEE